MSNREEQTRQAEKCLRLGRVDEAIAHYQALAQLTPLDWGLVKLLADLLERAGQREGAAREFGRWADHLFAEGFHSKAAALYKKVLKLDASDERALWQLGEVSIELKLRADARVAFQRALDIRQRRGDAAGAALARERLAALDSAPSPAPPPSLAVPLAYATPRPLPPVVVAPEPVPAPIEAPQERLAPLHWEEEDVEARETRAVLEDLFVSEGVPEFADEALVEVALVATELPVLTLPQVTPLPPVTEAGGRTADATFDWADLLGRDVEAVRASLPAVVLGVETPADVYEVASPVPGASEVLAVLTVPDPPSDPEAPRIGDLRGQPFFAENAPLQPSFSMPTSWLSESPVPLPPEAPRPREPGDDFFFADDATPPRWALPTVRPAPAAEPVDVEEDVDLAQLLEELKQWDPELPEPRRKPVAESAAEALVPLTPSTPPPPAGPLDREPAAAPSREPTETSHSDGNEELDAAFADRQRNGNDRTVAEQQLAAGRVFRAAGLASEAARAFERASAEPRTRFEAALALAELHRSRGQLLEATAWYERAAMAPVPDAAVKRAVLYDLAESLEALGETDRALGVLLDLLSQVEDYRDARVRLDRLLRVDAGG